MKLFKISKICITLLELWSLLFPRHFWESYVSSMISKGCFEWSHQFFLSNIGEPPSNSAGGGGGRRNVREKNMGESGRGLRVFKSWEKNSRAYFIIYSLPSKRRGWRWNHSGSWWRRRNIKIVIVVKWVLSQEGRNKAQNYRS